MSNQIVLPPIQQHPTPSDFKPPPIHKLQSYIWNLPPLQSYPQIQVQTTTTILPPLSVQPVQHSSPSPPLPHVLSASATPSPPPVSVSVSASTIINPKKQRKKRECPQCHLFFSNLATHKSTHLSINSRPYVCHTCDRGFARPNDLQRHEKRHLKDLGQIGFKCPFYDAEDTAKCHPSGCFSRCDTFKNHLKALHFQYPFGTRKRQRNAVGGNCKTCGESFESADAWLATHVEPRKCNGIHNH